MDFIEEFKIPFFQFEITNWKNKKENLLSLYHTVEKNLVNTRSEISNVYSDFYKKDRSLYVQELGSILRDEFLEFMEKTNSKSCNVINAWFQRYTKSCFHSPHNHGTCGYSSVCYITYNDKLHQPTRFICPFTNFLDGGIIEYTPKNIREGTMIFFPSSLIHYALPNDSDEERIILSMNMNVYK